MLQANVQSVTGTVQQLVFQCYIACIGAYMAGIAVSAEQ